MTFSGFSVFLRLPLILLVGLMLQATIVSAEVLTIESLIDASKLSVSHQLLPENPVLGQEVTLRIEIATDRWFAAGTRFKLAQADNVVMLQRQALAVNSSEQRHGQSWVVQSWDFSVFPQKEGVVFIPEIELSLNINTEQGVVRGQYSLPSLAMEVSVPEQVRPLDSWLAAKSFTLVTELDKPIDELKEGDAFTLTITLQADNVLAMMLPEISLPAIDGLAIYKRPPLLKNDSNRGNKIARRIEIIDVVVEKTGRYKIPEMTFYWWDTDNQSLEELTFEAIDVVSNGSEMAGIVSTFKKADTNTIRFSWLWLLILVVFIVLITWLVALFVESRKNKILSARTVNKRFNKAIENDDAKAAIRWAYFYLDHYTEKKHAITLRQRLREVAEEGEGLCAQLDVLFVEAFFTKSHSPLPINLSLLFAKKTRDISRSNDGLRINP